MGQNQYFNKVDLHFYFFTFSPTWILYIFNITLCFHCLLTVHLDFCNSCFCFLHLSRTLSYMRDKISTPTVQQKKSIQHDELNFCATHFQLTDEEKEQTQGEKSRGEDRRSAGVNYVRQKFAQNNLLPAVSALNFCLLHGAWLNFSPLKVTFHHIN